MKGRVLIVAGSDPSGGAGVQGDIKTVAALGGYAAAAITALTAQDSTGVFDVLAVPPDFVRRQIDLVLADIGADCVKTGMLHDAGIIAAVAESLAAFPDLPLVLDPVSQSTSGAALLEPSAVGELKRQLIPRTRVLTPNLPEAEMLLGRSVRSVDEMAEAARALLSLGARAVVLKGGHLAGNRLRDVVVDGDETYAFESERIETRHTHGTGCSLASAIATGLAQGMALRPAIARAHDFVQRAIRTAPGLGRGRGPLNHAV